MFCGNCGNLNTSFGRFCSECGNAVGEVSEKENKEVNKTEIAGKDKRLKAFLWDMLIPILPLTGIFLLFWFFQIILYLFAFDSDNIPLNSIFLLGGILSYFWIFIYWILCLLQINKSGQTVGKKKFGIKVIEARSGNKVSIFTYLLSRVVTLAIISGLSAYIPFLSLIIIVDLLWIFLDKKNQAIHDKLFNTLVIKV